MKKILSLAFAVCILYGCGTDYAFALHNPFSKKSKHEAEKMVQTREEWEEKAKNINLEEREVPQYQRPEDKDFKPKSPPSKKFVKYNVNPGSREADISQIIKKQDIKSQGVFDPDFKYIAYAQYYYSPLYDQISSDIYVQKLKDGMTNLIDAPEVLKKLDLLVLQELIITKELKYTKEEQMAQVGIKYIKQEYEAFDAIDKGKAQASFIMAYPKMKDIKDVSKEGYRMPQKSTYFYPKLLSGIVINPLHKY